MIELVVFDMAGTTVDEDNVVYKTVRAAINSAGYSFTQDQVQAAGAGKEKSQAIRDVLALDNAEHDDDEVQAIFAEFKRLWTSDICPCTYCYYANRRYPRSADYLRRDYYFDKRSDAVWQRASLAAAVR